MARRSFIPPKRYKPSIMRLLGTLTGTGTVEVDGKERGPINYSIDVHINDATRKKWAYGVAGGDLKALTTAFNAGSAVLHLQNGGTVNVLVTKISMRVADLSVKGLVPGF